MAIEHLKRATKTPESETDAARQTAAEMLGRIEAGGEDAVRTYAERLDRWVGPVVVERAEVERRAGEVPRSVKEDIDFAIGQVRRFALAQRESVRDFEVELLPGLVAGQRLVPINVAGCYVPTGRYAHIASDWWLQRLTNYGSLFLGEGTTVAFGDKTSGPNHILPTKKAARYSAGLSVHKFLKPLTWQRADRDGCRALAPPTARISRLEGMEAHARTADARMRKYFNDGDVDMGEPIS